MALDWDYYKELFVAGDYRSLKEFSKEHNLEYSYVQKMSARDKWFAERTKRKADAAEKIKAESVERSVENFYEKRRTTLGIINRLKKRAEELLEKKSCDAKDLNALASAIYRCNEVEASLLDINNGDDKGVSIKINIADCKGEREDEST